MTNYNDGKWHGWNGGECPVHLKTDVQIVWQFKGGDIRDGKSTGLAYGWNWLGNESGDIIAFRVIKEYREPREWWINTVFGSDRIRETEPDRPHRYTRVREVLE